MQPAVSVPWRGAFAALLVMVAAGAGGAVAASACHWQPVIPQIFVDGMPPPPAPIVTVRVRTTVSPILEDWHWQQANALAHAIESRRYARVMAAAAAIRPDSPHAPWVPAALELAVEQLDATAAGYARMSLCGELARFVARVEEAWPAGRAAMRPVNCGPAAAGEARGGDRYAELAGGLARAIVRDDHDAALSSCAALHAYGEMPASCLVQACRARELAAAEAILEHLEDRPGAELTRVPTSEWLARYACERLGVTFFDGRSHVLPGDGGVWRPHPAELVRVHPDAPGNATTFGHVIVVDWD